MRALHHVRHEPALKISFAQTRKLLEQGHPQAGLETATDAQHSSAHDRSSSRSAAPKTSRMIIAPRRCWSDAEDVANLEKAAKQQQLHQHGTCTEHGCPDEQRRGEDPVGADAPYHLPQGPERWLLERPSRDPGTARPQLLGHRRLILLSRWQPAAGPNENGSAKADLAAIGLR